MQEPEIDLYTMRNVSHIHPRQEAEAQNKAGDARLQPFFFACQNVTLEPPLRGPKLVTSFGRGDTTRFD